MWWWLEIFVHGRCGDRICCGLLPIFYVASFLLLELKLMGSISWLWSLVLIPFLVLSSLLFIPFIQHTSNQELHGILRTFLKFLFISFLIALITLPLIADLILDADAIWFTLPLCIMEVLGIIMLMFLALVYNYGVNFSVHQRRGLYRNNQIGPEWGMSSSTRLWGWGWTYGIEWSWNVGAKESQQQEWNRNSSMEHPTSNPTLACSLFFGSFALTFCLVVQLLILLKFNASSWFHSPYFYFLLSMGTLFISSLFWGRSAYGIRMKKFNQQLQNMSCPNENRNVIREPKLAWT